MFLRGVGVSVKEFTGSLKDKYCRFFAGLGFCRSFLGSLYDFAGLL